MDILVLNEDLESIHILDTFNSLIWTDRYDSCGDFEIFMPLDISLLSVLREDNYLILSQSEHTMIIEKIDIVTDVEKGNLLMVTGRSLESILDRRIVWGQVVLEGNLQTEIHRLLDENFINPVDPDREINRLVFEESIDPYITTLEVSGQYTGDLVYDIIASVCLEKNIGFKVILKDDGTFAFSLYAGVDRSYSQELASYVVFSPNFENLISSNYSEDKSKLKTITLIGGEGEGSERIVTTASVDGGGTGLSRREIFTDARDLSRTTDSGVLTDIEYAAQLQQRGLEKLSEKLFTKLFDGQIEPFTSYLYGRDFFIGDIVQLISEHQLGGRAQILEFIHFQDESGIRSYPKFSNLD